MKKISCLLLLGLSLSLSAVELFIDFEKDGAKNWVPFKSGEKIEISTENPAEGSCCLKILPNGMKLNKNGYIKIDPNATYRISVKLRATSGKVRFSVVEFDKKKDWLKGTTAFIGENSSSSWRYFEKEWKAKNSSANYITIQFDGGEGFADEVAIEKVEAVKVVEEANKKLGSNKVKWESLSGTVENSGDNAFLLKNGKIGSWVELEGDKGYYLNVKMRGAIGQRVLFYYREFDANGNDLSKKDVLFAKTNTNDNEGGVNLFFSVGPKTAKVKLSIQSVGKVNIRDAEVKELAVGKSDLHVDVRPNRYYYYPNEDGMLNFAVYNSGKKMVRLGTILTRLENASGESYALPVTMFDFGGRVAPGNWLRGEIKLPVSELHAGPWSVKNYLISDGKIIDVQIRQIGISDVPYEVVTRHNVRNRKEPIFFMMLSQWPEYGMYKRFRDWGFDVIEPDLTWGELEPSKGNYCFDVINRSLDIAKDTKLAFGIKVMCWDVPADLEERMISSNGDIGHVPPIRGEGFDRLVNLWREIARRYKDHPQVAWYTPSVGMNDGPLHGSFTRCHSVKQCFDYSPANEAGWCKFLQARFSLAEVSKLYNKNFSSWSEVKFPDQSYKYSPEGEGKNTEPNNIFDLFIEYNAQAVTEGFIRIWDAIREVDPDTPILLKAGGGYLERVPKGFEYEKLFKLCQEKNILFVSTSTPALTAEPLKIERAQQALPNTIIVGEVGAEGEQFPAPPLCTSKCFYLTMRYDMPIMGFCVYPSDVPPDLWGPIKMMQQELKGYKRYDGKLRIYGDANMRTYSQIAIDMLSAQGSPYRKNMEKIEYSSYPFSHIYDAYLPWSNLGNDIVIFDAGSPAFTKEVETNLLKHAEKGGMVVLSSNSLWAQKGSILNTYRKNAVKNNQNISFYQYGKGGFYFPNTPTDLEKINPAILSPVRWRGNVPVLTSIMFNKQGDCKVILFNPGDKTAIGTLECDKNYKLQGENKFTLAPASLRLLNFEVKGNANE